MSYDKSEYNKDTKYIANRYGYTERTIINWVNNGYPLPSGKRIKFEGYLLIGRKLRFNPHVIDNFIERINEGLWEYSNALTKQKKVSKQAKIGIVNFISTVSDSAKRLQLLISKKQ